MIIGRRRRGVAAAVGLGLAVTAAGGMPPAGAGDGFAIPGRASGILQTFGRGSAASVARRAPLARCSLPGGGNWITDCATYGASVNEPSIAYHDGLFVAGSNNYNSYNHNSQLGLYWSGDGRRWRDGGILDVFPHERDNGAGDAGLAFDADGVLYYSSIFFSYADCEVGGVELLRRNPVTGTWAYEEIAENTADQFNDKPAIAIDDRFVYQAWTQFDFCPRQQVPHLEVLKVAISPLGPTPAPPTEILTVPGAIHTEGAALAPDGHGGFWLTWEEFKNNRFTEGQIRFIHYNPDRGWSRFRVISPDAFKDLPIPLPEFRFTTNSFPMMAVGSSGPMVVWCSYDTGVGRAYLWSNGTVRAVKDSGGHQFFPAIAAEGDRTWITFSQTNQTRRSFGQYLVSDGRVRRISTTPSFPNRDPSYLRGFFIGDYNGITIAEGRPVPIWADVRPPHFWTNTVVAGR